MRRLDWNDLTNGVADRHDGKDVEIAGWMAPPDGEAAPDYFLLAAEPPGCCLPSDPASCIEIFATRGVAVEPQRIAFGGRLHRLTEDPAGWRYQLREARPLDARASHPVSRRGVLTAGLIGGLLSRARTAMAMGGGSGGAPEKPDAPPSDAAPTV